MANKFAAWLAILLCLRRLEIVTKLFLGKAGTVETLTRQTLLAAIYVGPLRRQPTVIVVIEELDKANFLYLQLRRTWSSRLLGCFYGRILDRAKELSLSSCFMHGGLSSMVDFRVTLDDLDFFFVAISSCGQGEFFHALNFQPLYSMVTWHISETIGILFTCKRPRHIHFLSLHFLTFF